MLKILSVVIEGHKILSSNGYKKITITPESPYQLILGTNGSGKSVLQKEIIRVVSSGKSYYKGGRKTIRYQLNDSIVESISVFNKSAGEHEFLLDGENLNDGGTAKVQKQLVAKYLGFDDDLYDLITGRVKFTSMMPTQRRQWLTKLANSKMDYAFSQYNSYRKMERDTRASLKHVINRRNQIMNDVASAGSRESLKAELDREVITLNGMLRGLRVDVDSSQKTSSMLSHYTDRVRYLSAQLQTQSRVVGGFQGFYSDISKLEDYISKHNSHLEKLNERKETILTDLHTSKASLEEVMSGTGGYSLSEVEDAILRCNDRIKQHELVDRSFDVADDREELDASITDKTVMACVEVISILRGMESNEEGRYSSNALKEQRAQLETLQREKYSLDTTIRELESNIKHYSMSTSVQCPDCSSIFKPGLHKEHVTKWESDLKDAQSRFGEIAKEIETLEETIVHNSEFVRGVMSVVEVCSRNGLYYVKDYLMDHNFYSANPSSFIGFISEYRTYADSYLTTQHVKTELDSWLDLKRRLEAVSTSHVKDIEAKVVTLESDLKTVEAKLESMAGIYTRMVYCRKCHHDTVETKRELLSCLKELENCREQLGESIYNELMEEEVSKVQISVANLRKSLSDIERQEALLSELDAQRAQLELDNRTAMETANALSPFDGFIAKQLRYYIETIVGRINSVISEVWYSGMEVLPCLNEDGELDYKFPLRRDSSEHDVPDISECSFGQIEIINFSFIRVIMELSGLSQYPFFADELGVNFDEKHRSKIMSHLKNIVVRNEVSQIWMISHFATLHGTFQSPDVLIVNSDNITLPDRYNTHVVFE